MSTNTTKFLAKYYEYILELLLLGANSTGVYTLVILAIINIFIKLSILPIPTLKYVDRI